MEKNSWVEKEVVCGQWGKLYDNRGPFYLTPDYVTAMSALAVAHTCGVYCLFFFPTSWLAVTDRKMKDILTLPLMSTSANVTSG